MIHLQNLFLHSFAFVAAVDLGGASLFAADQDQQNPVPTKTQLQGKPSADSAGDKNRRDFSGRLGDPQASDAMRLAPNGTVFIKPHVYYHPLKHIYMYDIFASGDLQGWGPFEYTRGEPYVGSLPSEAPGHALTRGGLSGQQVLIQPATHATAFGRVIKRGSWIWTNNIRYECWFTFKNFGFKYPAKGANYGTFRFDIDTQMGTGVESDRRWFSIRWNSASLTWEYSCGTEDTQQWKPLPGNAKQELTWNQRYKYDWLYARMDINLGKHEYAEFQCANRVWNLRGLRPCKGKKFCGESNAQEADVLTNLINFTFSANKGDANEPSYLLIDSVVVSADE